MVGDVKCVKVDVQPRPKSKRTRSTLEQRLKIMAALAVLITAVVRLIELLWKVLQ